MKTNNVFGEKGEEITLYFKEGSSDKVYTVELRPGRPTGWVVTFAYGRRGSTMNTGTKTQVAVTFAKAKGIYDKLVAEKTGKGYTPGTSGTPYAGASASVLSTGILPQLLNAVSEDELENLIEDPAWWAQEKMDGRRMLIKREPAGACGINRRGLSVPLAVPVLQDAMRGNDTYIIDGESIGDTVYVFDVLELNGDNFRGVPYSTRLGQLIGMAFADSGAPIMVVPTAYSALQKRNLITEVTKARGEGIVFKRHDSMYVQGRPASGGTQLKYKLYTTGSFIVSKVNAKRSVSVDVLVNGFPMPVGNVTITPNKPIPSAGDIIEVRYLYAYKGGSLYQPTFLMVRDDIDASACTESQLKYKQDDEEAV